MGRACCHLSAEACAAAHRGRAGHRVPVQRRGRRCQWRGHHGRAGRHLVTAAGDQDEEAASIFGGSPPCLMHELTPDGSVIDPQQVRDVMRWRKAERERLLKLRSALSSEARHTRTLAIAAALDRLLPPDGSVLVSVYWPIKGEPDLRAWMRARAEAGNRIALPVAVGLGQPLSFREWRPEAR